jgi:hypothetical protein
MSGPSAGVTSGVSEDFMAPEPLPRHYRCRLCGLELPTWLPVVKRPTRDGRG